MKNLLDDVAAFQRAAGLPCYASVEERLAAEGPPKPEEITLRLLYMLEELEELFVAHSLCFPSGGAAHEAFSVLQSILGGCVPRTPDQKEVGDGLVDLIYFAVGTALTYGLPLDHMWDEVQRANMSKLIDGRIVRRADGKVLKPPGWRPPNHDNTIHTRSAASWAEKLPT